MTRRAFEHDGAQGVVGWDEATATYFAQHETGEHELQDIAGTHLGQHTQLRSMLDELRDQVTVPDEVAAHLQRDAPIFTAPAIEEAQLRHNELTAELQRAAGRSNASPNPTTPGVQR